MWVSLPWVNGAIRFWCTTFLNERITKFKMFVMFLLVYLLKYVNTCMCNLENICLTVSSSTELYILSTDFSVAFAIGSTSSLVFFYKIMREIRCIPFVMKWCFKFFMQRELMLQIAEKNKFLNCAFCSTHN